MQKWYAVTFLCFSLAFAGSMPAQATGPDVCAENDKLCLDFARLAEAKQFDQIIEKIDAKKRYSETAKRYIGEAYLNLAGRENNTPEQEEQFCLKALEYGATSAYMGLYFIYAAADEQKAIVYLKKYVDTKPQDPVPYVLLGESELEKRNYAEAIDYLTEARNVSHGRSSNLSWLLFQATYLKGDYVTAAAMLDESFSRGKTVGDLKALIASDPRYAEIGMHHEFKRFFTMISGIVLPRVSRR